MAGTTLSSIFISNTKSNTSPGPMLNVISNSLRGYLSSTSQSQRKKALMSWIKSTGELNGFVSKVARDIVKKFHFEQIDKKSNRNKLIKANTFAVEVNLRQIMYPQVFDILGLGEGYGWKGMLDKDTVNKKIKEVINGMKGQISTKESNDLYSQFECKQTDVLGDLAGFDEDLTIPKKYRAVASSTMEIEYDQYMVKKYIQRVGSNDKEFNPEEIIRYTFGDLDGKVNGFSAIETILVQVELLRFMWQNMNSFNKNGGVMDNLFILENTNPNSPSYKLMQQQLQKYKDVGNRHGNMLFTGKVTVQQLQQLDAMQFKDMGLYITGLMAMQWGIPKSAIPYIIGGTNTKDDTGGNSEKSYWEVIEYFQQLFADTMNQQLWIPHFGVKIVFDNVYLQQDIQKQTANQLKYNNLKLLDEMARGKGKEIKFADLMELVGVDSDMFEDYEAPVEPVLGTMNNQPNKAQGQSNDQKKVSDSKRTEQQNLMSRGAGSTSGTGKEALWTPEADLELKELKNIEVKEDGRTQEVPLRMLMRLYKEDKVIRSGNPPRMFMKQNESFTAFKYMSDDFVYRSIISNEDVPDLSFVFMEIGNNLYML